MKEGMKSRLNKHVLPHYMWGHLERRDEKQSEQTCPSPLHVASQGINLMVTLPHLLVNNFGINMPFTPIQPNQLGANSFFMSFHRALPHETHPNQDFFSPSWTPYRFPI